MKGSFKTALIAAVVSAFVAAGAAVATTQAFTLGTTNTVDAASTVTAGSTGLNAKLLQLTNNNTGSSATALGLTTPNSRPPMIVSSGAKVANLNADKLDGIDSTGFLSRTGTAADSSKLGGQLPSHFLPASGKAADAEKLDGIDSTGFLPASGVQRVGPTTVPLAAYQGGEPPPPVFATVGQLQFKYWCHRRDNNNDSGLVHIGLAISSTGAHTTYASLTLSAAGSGTGLGADLPANSVGALAGQDVLYSSSLAWAVPVTGSAVASNGQQVSFNLYIFYDNPVHPDTCMLGGSFIVK